MLHHEIEENKQGVGRIGILISVELGKIRFTSVVSSHIRFTQLDGAAPPRLQRVAHVAHVAHVALGQVLDWGRL